MFSSTCRLYPWWNFSTERKLRQSIMMGGTQTKTSNQSLHKTYFKKFRKNAFPSRTRQHWNISMTGISTQRPQRMSWPYDICSLIFNRPNDGADKIGYVVGTAMAKTAVVTTNHFVYYPKFNVRVSRASRVFAHDEDMAAVEGDLVHVKLCRKISRYKHYYIFSILEPNVEARERLKIGLRAVPPPLFGYPVARRIVKLNLTKPEATKHKLASAVQEHVQEFYKYAGRTGDAKISRAGDSGDTTFDDVNALVSPNAPPTAGSLESDGPAAFGQLPSAAGAHLGGNVVDSSNNNGEFLEGNVDPTKFWMNQEPKNLYDYKNFSKTP